MYYLRNFDKQADAIGQKAYLPTIAIVGGVNKVGYFNGDASKDNVFSEDGEFIKVGEAKDPRVVCTYNATSTTGATQLLYSGLTLSEIASMEIDGVNATVATGYTFTTTGEHTVKYTFKDNTTIPQQAFRGCSGLTSVTIPDSVTSIGGQAFFYCFGLKSVTIGSGVTSIGDIAFYGCTSLTSVDIPDSVTSINQQAFSQCSTLKSVTIGSGVTYIGRLAFYYTPWSKSYSVDTSHQYENIVYINNVAYQATSTGITSCTVKEGTVSIAGSAFQYCSGLTSVDIPDSVTSIGYEAFDSCSSLTTINYKGTVDQWKTIKRESMWNYNVPSTTKVTCSDGNCGLDDK